MTETTAAADSPREPALDPKVAYAFCRFAGGFWRGESARVAWALTIGLGLCLAASTAVTVALNQWNRWFFDALEKKDVAAVWQAVFSVLGIVGLMAAVGVGIVLTRETLQVRWRAWLIERLLARWLGERRFYRMNANRTEPANPEYRIADDSRWATEPLTDLGIGLVIAVLNATAFISILWVVGGSYSFEAGGSRITIPAYMVIVALLYGVLMSGMMLWIGKPLPGFVYAKNEREGDFRFALMRLRENAESVALMSGHIGEKALLGRVFASVVAAWMLIVRRHGHVAWITNSSGPLIPIVPLLFAAPKYLSGELSLGQVTQLAGAFIAVQGAISWVVDNFNRIAEWYASARRVMDILDACDALDGDPRPQDTIRLSPSDEAGLAFVDVSIGDPSGAGIVENVELVAKPGTSTFVLGDTSVGKSSLVRAAAGLWTAGRGTIERPPGHGMMIVPRRPYMPLGTLAEGLCYPDVDGVFEERGMEAALVQVGLGHLAGRLDERARWDQRLSTGERQRLAIARAILHAPDVLILDDALSALDAQSQAALLKALRAALPSTAIVSLGQTLPPGGLYDQVLKLTRRGTTRTTQNREADKDTTERVK
jgi:putative ATP-binding cassette transporter